MINLLDIVEDILTILKNKEKNCNRRKRSGLVDDEENEKILHQAVQFIESKIRNRNNCDHNEEAEFCAYNSIPSQGLDIL